MQQPNSGEERPATLDELVKELGGAGDVTPVEALHNCNVMRKGMTSTGLGNDIMRASMATLAHALVRLGEFEKGNPLPAGTGASNANTATKTPSIPTGRRQKARSAKGKS